ncbi:hypothetical protein N5J06_10850 [Ralstonia sp. CHL-2022]|uniref:Uncharacterized protein n=1 Tax=Ralstonia mojiangensis TaxID=2953895 RepID=A0AAE3I4C0_9RALS|nr:hypothetical protein [Ralstonia mojiangensis]MCT7311445.1 hypothetical protein [Ralstonia mojiangensis]MCT7317428.1 hypothetical protein [Ralstonia mojiangensis]
MPVQLTNHLRENLSWLASNWEAKQLQYVSSFNENFYAALLSILDGSATRAAVELVISGTRGKVADGYAHVLIVEPECVARDPFVVLRILGDISTELAQTVSLSDEYATRTDLL